MSNRSVAVAVVVAALGVSAPAAWSVIYDPAQNPAASSGQPSKSANPQAQAALEAGIAALKAADALDAAADGSKSRGLPPSMKGYTQARRQFEEATKKDPNLPDAWNGLGYSQRKLGEYDAALQSYARALALKPGYPEATEYRGEAYLGMNRVDDAKQAYLDLFAGNRVLADKLLGAMKSWIDKQKEGSSAAVAADLAKWVEERSRIAAQTASLTREGTAAGWR